MTESLVGSHLGKYQIQSSLGKGGMGMVYMGYDPLLDRKVAIKVLAPHLVWEEGFVERFLREARAAARIKHPNIVTVYDVGQEQESFYFVMEYLEGQTLAELIRKRGALPPEEVLSILRPLADALDYAHRHGLVHRDIKPGNILIGSGNRVTLTDFGIARAAEETRLTTVGTIMGTPEYMSPEQAWGEEVGHQTDLYSLAVVAYEMLSGRVPFSGTTPHAVLYKLIHEPPPPIRQARPDLPAGVEAVLARALDKAPAKRYETTAAFVGELEAALAGKLDAPTEQLAAEKAASSRQPAPIQPVPAVSEKAPAKAASARKRAPARRVPTVLWVMGALGVLAIVAGVIGIAWFGAGKGDGSTPEPTAQAEAQPTATSAPEQPAPSQPAAQPTAIRQPLPEEPPCDDPAGCVLIRPGEPVQIGAMLYLSEAGLDAGVTTMRGLEMALESRGSILDHPIGLIKEDSGCDPDGAMRAAQSLAARPGIVAIIGPTCSNAVTAASERLCPESIPLISPSASAPGLTAPDRPAELRCFLRTSMHEDAQGQAVAEFAWSTGVRRAATIADTSFLSESLANAFAQQFRELGGKIVAQEVLGPDNPEAAPAVERVAQGEPQLIFMPVYIERGVEITHIVKENPQLREVKLVGADGMFTRTYLAATGEVAMGIYLSAPDMAVVGPAYLEYMDWYQGIYGEPPRVPFGAAAHDAAMMLFAAIEDVAQQLDNGALLIGRQALLERLFATRNFSGVTGKLSCSPNGNCGSPSAAIYQIVSPDPGFWSPGASPDNNPRRIWP